jgi:hypothetical protein
MGATVLLQVSNDEIRSERNSTTPLGSTSPTGQAAGAKLLKMSTFNTMTSRSLYILGSDSMLRSRVCEGPGYYDDGECLSDPRI